MPGRSLTPLRVKIPLRVKPQSLQALRHRVINCVPILLLSSPLHRLMGRNYALLSVTGSRSGTVYKIPVAQVDLGDRIGFTTDSRWVRNLRGGAAVGVRIHGCDYVGHAEIVTDEDRAVGILRALTKTIPSYAGPAELTVVNGEVSETELREAIRHRRTAVEITKHS